MLQRPRIGSRRAIRRGLAALRTPVVDSVAHGSALGDPGASASVGRRKSIAPSAPSRHRGRSSALDVVIAHVERVAAGARSRQARHRARLAPTRLPPVLGVEESPPDGSSSRSPGDPYVDSSNGYRESALGCAADSRGTAEAGDRGESVDRCEVHAATRYATIADVADLPGQPCRPDRGRRFHRRSNRHGTDSCSYSSSSHTTVDGSCTSR